jgi:hypothetical protein
MYYLNNGKYISLGGKLARVNLAKLVFSTSGTTFPYDSSVYRGWHTTPGGAERLMIWSSVPNNIKVDYGDGTTVTKAFEPANGLYLVGWRMDNIGDWVIPVHNYADGDKETPRIVSMEFEDMGAIVEIQTVEVLLKGTFPSDIDKLTGLNKINLNTPYALSSFPVSIANNRNLQYLTLREVGSAMTDKIPDEFFNIPLIELSISLSVDLSDIETSNFRKINQLKNTLQTLSVDGCNIATVPEELGELTSLKTLNIGQNKFNTLPATINLLSALETLNIAGRSPELTGWGDISGLTKLNSIEHRRNVNLQDSIPANWASLTALKNITCWGCYQTTARGDNYVNSFYDFVVANAPLTGTSVDPFRSMTVNYYFNSSEGNAALSGIYQQPAGYVQGADNGTPASPLEKVWVLVNQYGHAWTLPA